MLFSRHRSKVFLYVGVVLFFSLLAVMSLVRCHLLFSHWFLALIPAALISAFIAWYHVKPRPTHAAFGVIFFLCGLLYLFSVPMLQVSDEPQHYLRSYEIAAGRSPMTTSDSSVGDILPGNLIPEQFSDPAHTSYRQILDALDERIDRQNMQEYAFPGAALYSPVTYLPQALGIFLADLFSDSSLLLLYAGRLSTLLVVTLLVTMAVKFFPFSKSLPILLLLVPIYVHKSGSMSADGFTISVIMLFLSYVLYLQYDTTGRLSLRQLAPIYVLVFLISQCKIVYLPVCLFFFVLSPARFGRRRRYACHLTALVLLALVGSLGWLAISSAYLSTGYSSSGDQIQALFSDPLGYVVILLRTFKQQIVGLVGQMIGSGMGVGGVQNSRLLVYGYLLAILLTTFLARRGGPGLWQTRDIWLSLLSAIGVTLLTCTALFIQWTPPGQPVIIGLQGRYFLPVLSLGCLAVMQFAPLEKLRKPLDEALPLLFALGANLAAVVSCFSYGFTL